MLYQLRLFLLISLSSASVLPLKFSFGGHHPVLRGVRQCEGHDDTPMMFVSGTMPDSICMPGESEMNMHTIISQDLPMDLVMKLDLKKLSPFPMTVPCLNGVGSCVYDLCEIIASTPALCDALPDFQPCSCPLLKGEMTLEGVKVPVPDMGPIMDAVMEGRYSAHARLYGASNEDFEVGCVDFEFELKKC